MTLTRRNYYRGCDSARKGCVVLGYEFGPCLFAFDCDLEEALNEFDERFGQRVEDDDPDLADYGDTPETQWDRALNDGDIRINDGGTAVWVSHYEWMREFNSRKAALAAFKR